uniref:Uncharacterized protein n=1 Tax=Cacopsylla melanoneura TaxID=428564 RepID=A0A8D8X4I4_9HEMI
MGFYTFHVCPDSVRTCFHEILRFCYLPRLATCPGLPYTKPVTLHLTIPTQPTLHLTRYTLNIPQRGLKATSLINWYSKRVEKAVKNKQERGGREGTVEREREGGR